MILVVGDGSKRIAAVLESSGLGPIHKGTARNLEDSSALRNYHAVVIDKVPYWTGATVNALWETDGLVFILGKVPPPIQALTGAELDQKKKLGGVALRLDEPGGGLEAPVIKLKHRLALLPIKEPLKSRSLGQMESEGRKWPLFTKCGRVFYCPLALGDVPRSARNEYLNMLSALIRGQMSFFDFHKDQKDNLRPSFSDLQAVVPALYTGPNVRDYSYLLRRVTRIMNVLTRFSPHKELAGKDVLDLGCGFGTTTVVSSQLYGLGRVQGVDVDNSLMNVAKEIVDSLGLANVSFSCRSMLDLDLYAGQFDLVIVNNAFNYFHDNREFESALAGFVKALRSGGSLVILTPSRLTPMEAFTKYPGIQFLPRDMAAALIAREKLSVINYHNIKLPSPFESLHWAHGAGFDKAVAVDAYGLNQCNLTSFFKPRFYMVATKC